MGIWGYFAAPKAPRKNFGVKHEIFWLFFVRGRVLPLLGRGWEVLPKSPWNEKPNKVFTVVVPTDIKSQNNLSMVKIHKTHLNHFLKPICLAGSEDFEVKNCTLLTYNVYIVILSNLL